MKLVVMFIALAAAPAAAAPAWCKPGNDGLSQDDVERTHDADVANAVQAIVSASCKGSNEAYGKGQAEKHAAVDKARAELGAKLGISEAEWADAKAFVDANRELKAELSTKSLATLTPVDQYVAIVGDYHSDPVYTADALDAHLTETGRLGLLQWCLKQTPVTHESDALMSWGACEYDVKHFDVKKLFAEVAADTAHPAAARFALRVRGLQMASVELPKLVAEENKLFAKDATYKKPFADALAARDAWKKTVGANAKLLALAEQMDSGIMFDSRKAMDGCEAATFEALAAAASTFPAKAFDDMHDSSDYRQPDKGFAHKAAITLQANPELDVAAIAYMQCQPKRGLSQYLAYVVDPIPGQRGPRMAAITLYRLTDYKFDDSKAEPRLPPNGGRPWANITTEFMSSGGVVKTVKKDGDHLKVSVEKTSMTQIDCVQEHWGNRVIGIDSNGKYVYQLICDKEAPVVHDTTPGDFEISAEYEKMLKPGVVFSAVRAGKPQQVLAVWADKKAKLPSWVLGGAVK